MGGKLFAKVIKRVDLVWNEDGPALKEGANMALILSFSGECK